MRIFWLLFALLTNALFIASCLQWLMFVRARLLHWFVCLLCCLQICCGRMHVFCLLRCIPPESSSTCLLLIGNYRFRAMSGLFSFVDSLYWQWYRVFCKRTLLDLYSAFLTKDPCFTRQRSNTVLDLTGKLCEFWIKIRSSSCRNSWQKRFTFHRLPVAFQVVKFQCNL